MLISRKEEQRLLLTAVCADESRFIAVYGRILINEENDPFFFSLFSYIIEKIFTRLLP